MNSNLSAEDSIISVVVLTLNSERYVRRCLDSLASQTLHDFEVLVVDAGSKDQTKAIVASYDARFKWLELPGSDQGSARNFGLRQSRGSYLTFLDSDDYYLPGKLAGDVKSLQSAPEMGVSFCAAWHFRTERPDRMGLKKNVGQPWTLKNFLAGQNRNLNTMCLRRQVWEKGFAFGEGQRGKYAEEWQLQLELAVAGVPMLFREEPLVVVEARPDSHTTWSMQWIMKARAVTELEKARLKLSEQQQRQYQFQRLLDTIRVKLVVALLLDGQKGKIPDVVRDIRISTLRWKAGWLSSAVGFVPQTWVRAAISSYWTFFQDRSFTWQPAAQDKIRLCP